MEKNTILAIFLSIAVLFGYETLFVAPKRAEMLKNAQALKSKEPTTNSVKTTIESPAVSEKTTSTTENAIISTLKTTSVGLELSNMGGSLHKIKFLPIGTTMPLTGVLDIVGFDQNNFNLVSADDASVAYLYKDKNWQIGKVFSVSTPGLVKVRMEIKNISQLSKLNSFEFKTINIDSSRMDISNNRETMLDEYSIAIPKKVYRKGNAFKFGPKESKVELGEVNWIGFRDHFTAVIVKPEFETKGFEIKTVTEKDLSIIVKATEKNLDPGEAEQYEFTIYAGDQDKREMATYAKGFERIVAFSNFAPIEWVSQAIYHSILFIQGIIKSWGLSIVLIGVLIYGLTYPMTIKSMMSMRKMQEVQPKIVALRERHKGDPQKLNQEVMEIYRREKINPLGGCLPFILQMPFFLAIYQVLWRASYFQGKSFLWIKDLSQADKLFILPFSLPFLGNEFNILPILMAVVMFFQQKLSSKSMVVTDETQAMQQKMMMYFFPVFIGFIFYKFASSLSLYFTMFYLLSTITQWKMSKKPVK